MSDMPPNLISDEVYAYLQKHRLKGEMSIDQVLRRLLNLPNTTTRARLVEGYIPTTESAARVAPDGTVVAVPESEFVTVRTSTVATRKAE